MPKKYLDGFDLRSKEDPSGNISVPVAAAVTVAKGDVLFNSAGYGALATSLDNTIIGVALEDADNSAGAAGDLTVLVLPIHPSHRYRVPVEANTVIAQTDVFAAYDLESEDGIDISDTTITAYGFFVEEIDISSDATDINTNGYAIGRFRAVS